MQPVFVIGDTHGEWDELFVHLDNAYLEDCVLIHVGDIGIGFVSAEMQIRKLNASNARFKERNIMFYGIRGNHDDPAYFSGDVVFSHLELLPDYTTKTLADKKFLFVGGAISIDRTGRILNRSWWQDEEFVLRPDLITTCDVLITHTAPTWNFQTEKATSTWFDADPTLWDECIKERQNTDKLIELSQCRKHFCGHFHTSSFVSVNGCDSTILDICEIKEVR
jgi:predicted phosphodiesterase